LQGYFDGPDSAEFGPPTDGSALAHGILDGIGMVPGAELADFLNLILYSFEGDAENAGFSAAAMIPFLGSFSTAGKYTSKAAKVVNGNSKLSKNAQHLYEIYEVSTGKIVKTGVSGDKVSKAGKSYRATRQVNGWKKAGQFESRIVQKLPGGEGARKAILRMEEEHATKLRLEGHLDDLNYHIRP
jgi:hypothetical protein